MFLWGTASYRPSVRNPLTLLSELNLLSEWMLSANAISEMAFPKDGDDTKMWQRIEFVATSSCWCCRGSCYGIHRNLIDTEHLRSNNKQDEDIFTTEVFISYKPDSVPQCYPTYSNYNCIRKWISTRYVQIKHNSWVLWFWALGFERAHSSILHEYSCTYPLS